MKHQLAALILLLGGLITPSAKAQTFQAPEDRSFIELWMHDPDATNHQGDPHGLTTSLSLNNSGRTSHFSTKGSYGTNDTQMKINLESAGEYSAASWASVGVSNKIQLFTNSDSVKLTINFDYEFTGFSTENRFEITLHDPLSMHYYVQEKYTVSKSDSFTVTLPNSFFYLDTALYTGIEASSGGTHSAIANVTYTLESFSVPEPATIGLMIMGGCALLLHTRKRRQKTSAPTMKTQLAILTLLLGGLIASSAKAQTFQGPEDRTFIDLWMHNPNAEAHRENHQGLTISQSLNNGGRTSHFSTKGSYETNDTQMKLNLESTGEYSSASWAAVGVSNKMYLFTNFYHSESVKLTIKFDYKITGFITENRFELTLLDPATMRYCVQETYPAPTSDSISVVLPNTFFYLTSALYTGIEASSGGIHDATADVTYTIEKFVAPEPATIALMIMGGCAILFHARKRR